MTTADESQEPRTRVPTTWLVRFAGLAVFVAALGAYVEVNGLPRQGYQVVIILWLATVAWDVRRPVREHLAFLRDWWPPFAVLLLYLYSRGVSDDLGIFGVEFTWPIEADRWLFGGTLPTEYLQAKLCDVPCRQSLPPRWYDVVLTTVYYSHFFAALAIGAVLWKRNRPEWIYYMRRYLAIISLSVVCYVLYPMAPPWMAARDGYLTDDVARITGRGWFDLSTSGSASAGAGTTQQHVSAIGNQVAAMPSLHSALAIFIAWWVIARFTGLWRWSVLLYPAAMLFSLVYYAEHYVVDEIAGALLVAVVVGGWAWWDRRRRVPQEEQPRAEASAARSG
ncbi:inositol phosphorylceramide synthase [Nocardioides sp. zg-536]|uniref:Inositol phosphorylceramide synthase n=1 Tax=Nocardioides faecalis TaxID=2803858 RepID=A0A939BRR9_9ACTN|nr:phosphatase PAP2 family protein [Nocardioides faecalis]MBM9458904.1 inositol phosphorylceramide synthase [Nocardioides faecalis]QVI60307.1 inositol phosphorylceramide synthase [Nocardioides faecalis]